MRRHLITGAVTLAAVAFIAACGGPMSASEGKRAADKVRRPAAETYWKLYNSLNGTVAQEDGRGEFPACADQAKNSVYYKITYTFFATSAKEPQADLTAAVKMRLSGIGWNLQPSQEHVYQATNSGFTVRLREIVVDAAGPQADALYIESPCTDVGNAHDAVSHTLDKYPAKEAVSSPIPTGFPAPTQ